MEVSKIERKYGGLQFSSRPLFGPSFLFREKQLTVKSIARKFWSCSVVHLKYIATYISNQFWCVSWKSLSRSSFGSSKASFARWSFFTSFSCFTLLTALASRSLFSLRPSLTLNQQVNYQYKPWASWVLIRSCYMERFYARNCCTFMQSFCQKKRREREEKKLIKEKKWLEIKSINVSHLRRE